MVLCTPLQKHSISRPADPEDNPRIRHRVPVLRTSGYFVYLYVLGTRYSVPGY